MSSAPTGHTAAELPPELAPRTPAFSRTELAELMQPHQANYLGKVFGGEVLAMIDRAAGIAAIRHASGPCVTAQFDRVTFCGPIEIGEMIRMVAVLNYAGRSSMEVEVQVYAMDVARSVERLTNTSYVTMVAIDDEGRPRPVPPLQPETPAEQARADAAQARMEERKRQRHAEAAPK